MQELELTQGTETETLEYGGPREVVIDERGNTVRVSVWGRHGPRRDVSLTAPAARRVAGAAVADGVDGEIVTETADDGAEVVVRERDGHRELTVSGHRRGRRVVRLDPFETEVAEGLRDAAAVVADGIDAEPTAGGEAA